jgi:hypothetical protein
VKSGDWKDILELVGIAAIVASLMFLTFEMQQTQRIASAQSLMTIYANKVETRSQQNQNVDIWRRGNSFQELTDDEAFIFQNLVQNKIDEGIFEAMQNERIGFPVEVATKDLAIFLFRNPGALLEWNRFVEDRKRYWGPLEESRDRSDQSAVISFIDAVSSVLVQLQGSGISVGSNGEH